MDHKTLFVSEMKNVEKKAWESFKAVATNFLGDRKSSNYKRIVSSMVTNIEKFGCMMNLKLHFDKFPENVKSNSEKQEER